MGLVMVLVAGPPDCSELKTTLRVNDNVRLVPVTDISIDKVDDFLVVLGLRNTSRDVDLVLVFPGEFGGLARECFVSQSRQRKENGHGGVE